MQLGNDQLRADRSNAGAEPFALCGRKFIFFFSLPWPRTRQGFPSVHSSGVETAVRPVPSAHAHPTAPNVVVGMWDQEGAPARR